MTKRRPDYCPYCGCALETRGFDGRDRRFCPDCGEFVFQNPMPGAHVVVLDGASVLLIERAIEPDYGAWAVPGGILEVDEPARLGAARELEEEAGLSVDPDSLELVRTGFDVDDPEDGSYLSICFAVERADTSGELELGGEVSDAMVWSFAEMRETDQWIRSVDRRRIAAAVEAMRGEAVVVDAE